MMRQSQGLRADLAIRLGFLEDQIRGEACCQATSCGTTNRAIGFEPCLGLGYVITNPSDEGFLHAAASRTAEDVHERFNERLGGCFGDDIQQFQLRSHLSWPPDLCHQIIECVHIVLQRGNDTADTANLPSSRREPRPLEQRVRRLAQCLL